jgi:hypothetical protein
MQVYVDLILGLGLCFGKVFIQGFYWPKAASDAADLVQKCEN